MSSIDDHELLRKGIRFSLLAFDDIKFVAEICSILEALKLCSKKQPDVILMDMQLGDDMDGVTTTQLLLQRYPNILVLAFSGFREYEWVNGTMKAGAIGY